MRQVAIYTRISDDREGDALGVQRQEDECRRVARNAGWDVARVFTENDTSAFRKRRVPLRDRNGDVVTHEGRTVTTTRVIRPEFERLIASLRAGECDLLLVYDLDRLARDPRDLEDVIDLRDHHGVVTRTVTGAKIETDDDVTMARVMIAMANKSSRDSSRRIKLKAQELAKEGKVGGGGTRPFGYDDDRVTVRHAEAAEIKDAARRVLAGDSLRSVAADWNKRGVATVTGVPWTAHVVKRLLRSARIAGLREHQGVVITTAKWPAIITVRQHERLRRLLDDESRNRRGTGAGRKYLLSGLVVCSLCGKPLISRPASKRPDDTRRPSMICASGPPTDGCGRMRMNAVWLEEVVERAVVMLLDGPALNTLVAQRGQQGDDDAVQQQLNDDRQALRDLSRDRYVDRVITDDEYRAARAPLVKRIAAGERRLTASVAQGALTSIPLGEGALAAAWPDWSLDRKRAVIDAVVRQVVVKPGLRGRNRYTPEQIADRIEIVWRDDQ